MDNAPTNVASTDTQQGAGVELARMLTIIKRALLNWKPSALIVALGLIAGVSFAVVRKPVYKSETIVIYRQGVKLSQEGGGVNLTLGTRLQEMLLARSRLEVILDELGLYQEVKAKRGDIEAVEQFRKDVTFKARSTDTFSISYKSLDPETVKRVTERLAQSLIEENQRLRVQQSKVQQEFLELEKKQREDALKTKERALAVFLSEHPEFALDATGNFGVSARAQRDLERERAIAGGGGAGANLLALKRQQARLNAALTSDVPVMPALEAPADPAALADEQAAQGNLSSARADLASKQAKFGDTYPDVVAAKARVKEAEAKVRVAAEKVAASRGSSGGGPVSSDPEVTKQKIRDRIRKIDSEIAALEGRDSKKDKDKDKGKEPVSASEEAMSVVGLETEWARHSRDVSEARDQMNELERNYFRAQIEAASSLGGYSDQVVVLDPPYVPTRPEAPGKTLIVLLAGGAAFAIAMILALMRALLDSRIYEEADLGRIAPVLAVVPKGGRRGWWRR